MSSTMRTETFIVILTLGLGLLVHFVLATEYNRVLIFKGPIEGKILLGHVIRKEKVPNEGSCRVKCFLEPNCVSINVGPADDQGQRPCELNDFTDESASQSGLKERTGHIHYAVEQNFCHSSPCPGGNFICQVGFTAKHYRCVCVDGYKGEKCDKASCKAQWTSFGSANYSLCKSPQKWKNAKLICQHFGSKLVKIESEEENEFIKGEYLSSEGPYWIGLSDADHEGQWKWTDGTGLTGYQEWKTGQPNNKDGKQNCVAIYRGNAKWNDLRCSRKLGFICEK